MYLKLKHKPAARSRFRLPIQAYLAYLLIGASLLTGMSFARYITTDGGADSARVAAGTIKVTYDENTTAIEMTRPENDNFETDSFQFHVSNPNSEVAIRYDVIVSLNEPLPNGVTMQMDGTDGSTDDQKTFTFENAGVFSAGTPETQDHTLSFIGDYRIISQKSTRTIALSVLAEQIN